MCSQDVDSDQLMVKRRKIENEVISSIHCLDLGIKKSANQHNQINVTRSIKDQMNLCSPGMKIDSYDHDTRASKADKAEYFLNVMSPGDDWRGNISD